MATPHMVAGAAIGTKLRSPWLALPLAFASHFLLDFAPHLDAHSLFGSGYGRTTSPEAIAAALDFFLGAIVVGVLVGRQPGRRLAGSAALLAVLIDLVEYLPPFGPWLRGWPGTAWLRHFHHAIQRNLTGAHWPLGFSTQAAVMALSLWVLLAGRSAASHPEEAQAAARRPGQEGAPPRRT